MYRNYIEELHLQPDEIIDYLRKSRADDPLLTVEEVLARHESILDEWAEKNLGAKIPEANKYREIVSGETIADRPEMQKVLKLIESPKIKAILVVEVQRLSRGDLEDCGRLMKLLRYTNTLVITPQMVYDLRDEYDRDAFERELKRGNEFLEYTKKIMQRGTLRSVSEGNYLGSIPPYGYDKVWVTEGKRKYPTLAIIEEQANIVRMIFDMYVNQDMTIYSIASRLDEMHIAPPKGNNWSVYSIKGILENIHYIGKIKRNFRKTITVVENGEIVKMRPRAKDDEMLVYEGRHEAIISENIFYRAQEKRGRNHRAKPTTKIRNPFAGLVRCKCGRAMSLRMYKTPEGKEKSSARIICDNQAHCSTSSCTYSELEGAIVDVLKHSIKDCEIRLNEDNTDAIKYHERLIKSLEKKLSDLQAKELSQWEAQADPNVENRMPQHIFQMLNAKLLKEKEDVETALQEARRTMPTPDEHREKMVRLQDALNALLDPDVDAAAKNKLLKSCIERIEYNREKSHRVRGEKNVITDNGWTTSDIELDVIMKV